MSGLGVALVVLGLLPVGLGGYFLVFPERAKAGQEARYPSPQRSVGRYRTWAVVMVVLGLVVMALGLVA